MKAHTHPENQSQLRVLVVRDGNPSCELECRAREAASVVVVSGSPSTAGLTRRAHRAG